MAIPLPMPSPSSGSSTLDGEALAEVRGSTRPRLFTPPIAEPTGVEPRCECEPGCPLDAGNSRGFDQIEFADVVLGHPFDPWQRWLVVHAGELLPDGLPRFRHVLVLVARGRTGRPRCRSSCPCIGSSWRRSPLILGTSTILNYAKESWSKAVALAEKAPGLDCAGGPAEVDAAGER